MIKIDFNLIFAIVSKSDSPIRILSIVGASWCLKDKDQNYFVCHFAMLNLLFKHIFDYFILKGTYCRAYH